MSQAERNEDVRSDLRLAGTAIVIRHRDAPEVLMVRRAESMRFLGGFWVFPGGTVEAAEAAQDARGVGPIAVAALAACRELQEEAGLSVVADQLLHWAHWITPSAVRRRFDTHFFLAPAPPDQSPQLQSSEASEFQWVRPEIWQSASLSGEFPLTPPTLVVLRELGSALKQHGSLEALFERERERTIRPVLPKLIGESMVVLPWDAHYGTLPGEGIAWDPAGVSQRVSWPSRLSASIRGG